jgi:hypothetical protein
MFKYVVYLKVPEIWILCADGYEYIEIPLGVSAYILLESLWQAASSSVVGFIVGERISIVVFWWASGFAMADLREHRVCTKLCFKLGKSAAEVNQKLKQARTSAIISFSTKTTTQQWHYQRKVSLMKQIYIHQRDLRIYAIWLRSILLNVIKRQMFHTSRQKNKVWPPLRRYLNAELEKHTTDIVVTRIGVTCLWGGEASGGDAVSNSAPLWNGQWADFNEAKSRSKFLPTYRHRVMNMYQEMSMHS